MLQRCSLFDDASIRGGHARITPLFVMSIRISVSNVMYFVCSFFMALCNWVAELCVCLLTCVVSCFFLRVCTYFRLCYSSSPCMSVCLLTHSLPVLNRCFGYSFGRPLTYISLKDGVMSK